MMEVFEEGVGEGRCEAAVADAKNGLNGGASSPAECGCGERNGCSGGASSRFGITRGRI